ncbi:MAG: hypothetical protein NWE77_02705 [Candidatus Bathyarchaeota archaeon]|nr:hypothetical protein [Candidatus Bathyarchaeota archaeon]
MGKTVSFWITTEEEQALEVYCKKHNLTKYEALRTALANLLTKGG